MYSAKISPERIFIFHLTIIAGFAFAYWAVAMGGVKLPILDRPYFQRQFDLNVEGNLPSYFSGLGLLACSLVSAQLWRATGPAPERRFWMIAAAALFVMSFDEACALHEGLTFFGDRMPLHGGIFYLSWWMPYLVLLAGPCLVAVPGFLRIDAVTRITLCVAGAVFVTGALGFELLESKIDYDIDVLGVGHVAALHALMKWYILVEETFEMLGVAIALRALLGLARRVAPMVTIGLAETRAPAAYWTAEPREARGALAAERDGDLAL